MNEELQHYAVARIANGFLAMPISQRPGEYTSYKEAVYADTERALADALASIMVRSKLEQANAHQTGKS